MTELKCPFCNKKLEPIGTSGQFQCGTWGCDASFNFIATRDVWEYIDRTRKALDVAVDALKRANNTYCAEEEDITIDLTESAAHKWQRTAYQMEMPISIALEQIKELEQKDNK